MDNECSQNDFWLGREVRSDSRYVRDVPGDQRIHRGRRRGGGGVPGERRRLRRPAAPPLGPDSLTWRYFGQVDRSVPGHLGRVHAEHASCSSGAAVEEHSIFFLERIPRLLRSIYPIGGVVFDGDRAPKTGAGGPRLPHRHQGCGQAGTPLQRAEPRRLLLGARHLLQVHLLAAEKFGGGSRRPTKRQLFDEHVAWYRMYGMSMRSGAELLGGVRAVPGSHVPQRAGDNCTPPREVMDLSTMPKHPSLQWILDPWLWAPESRKVMQRFLTFTTVALSTSRCVISMGLQLDTAPAVAAPTLPAG